MRRAKIVCTIGPASRDEKTLKRLIDAGMDVARVNFSHGSREEHAEVVDRIRRLSDSVAIMQDLQGPKIRIGEVPGGELQLADGHTLTLTTDIHAGESGKVHVTYSELPIDVSPGDNIYLADGLIHLEVEHVTGNEVRCRILHGGLLTSRKGVNLPGVNVSAAALTDKDRDDLEFGARLGFDYVALSFVRSADEVREVKWLLNDRKVTSKIIAKIEKREALQAIDEILEVADALMIARGDLGVEISTEEVPVAQKSLISSCLRVGKPVITATQMLESMVYSERPTRAEASDVANAVLDGSDAVMLSAETATGRYPVESVTIMDRIIRKVEGYGSGRPACGCGGESEDTVPDNESPPQWICADELAGAVCAGAVKVAQKVSASSIACLTHSGNTARMLSGLRPRMPILALTDDHPVVRQMGLVWGVTAIPVERIEATERVFAIVREKVAEAGCKGYVVLTAGIPTKERGATNSVHVIRI